MHLANAAAMWASRAPGAERSGDYLLAEHPAGARVVLLTAGARPEHVLALAPRRTLVVEDAYGVIDPHAGTLHMPVMIRQPGRMPAVPAQGVRVTAVTDPAQLAVAERVMVDGFPLPAYQPWSAGQALPPALLTEPGWRVWLASCDGEPAAAGCTYDDGTAVGVYWLATLPRHRSRGAGRTLLTTALAARPDRHFTLVATEAGQPLYESLGFATAGLAAWHTRPPLTS
ncbi:GNAT family N-acetyltransferase [Actinoplanes sp. DH11]|uniref:GNAT family N-acetyltransferase n=1 Tax=Actinoplanes sp. DH11 TaxID=2857011 RepID=UPI001E3FF0EB|nr:GNAT family N-acetyltransferase [Actinoplanes sp. DH11]